jgi:hypothetical protein
MLRRDGCKGEIRAVVDVAKAQRIWRNFLWHIGHQKLA